MRKKIVLFVSPDLEKTIDGALRSCDGWEYTIHSTAPSGHDSLCDVARLTELMQGADTCFIATTTDFNRDPRLEVEEGMALGQACKRSAVKNIVVSAHLHCERTIGIPARHYDSKADIYSYIRHTLDLPVAMVNIPPTYEMFYDFLCPTARPEGYYELVFPTAGPASIDFVAQSDVGACLLPVFEHADVFTGKTVALCGDKLTGKMVTALFNEELSPLRFKQRQVTIQEAREKPVTGAIDLANMFEFLGRADLKSSLDGCKELHPTIKTLRSWVRENRDTLHEAVVNNVPPGDDIAPLI